MQEWTHDWTVIIDVDQHGIMECDARVDRFDAMLEEARQAGEEPASRKALVREGLRIIRMRASQRDEPSDPSTHGS